MRCSATVPCHLKMFLPNSQLTENTQRNSINARICALWRLATGCYWDRQPLQVGIVWTGPECVCVLFCVKHCIPYATQQCVYMHPKIKFILIFLFFRCKNRLPCTIVHLFASSSRLCWLCVCVFSVYGLLQLADFMFTNDGKLYDSPRLVSIIIIIIYH